MDRISIGIIHEDKNGTDFNVISFLLGNFLTDQGIENKFKPACTFGSPKIDSGYIEKYVRPLFDITHVDTIIIVTDTDRTPRKPSMIKERLRALVPQDIERIIVHCPIPNIEQHIFDENSALHKWGEFDGSPLPYSEIKDPKERLQKIVGDKIENIPELIFPDAIKQITQGMDYNLLSSKSSTFQKLMQKMKKVIT